MRCRCHAVEVRGIQRYIWVPINHPHYGHLRPRYYLKRVVVEAERIIIHAARRVC